MGSNLKHDTYFTLVDVRAFLLNTVHEYEQLADNARKAGKNSYIVNRWEKRRLEAVRELGKVDKFMKDSLGVQ